MFGKTRRSSRIHRGSRLNHGTSCWRSTNLFGYLFSVIDSWLFTKHALPRGRNVDRRFCQFSELLIGLFFLAECPLKQRCALFVIEHFGVGPRGAIAGDLVMLNPLSSRNQSGIFYFRIALLFNHFGTLGDEAFHALTLGSSRGLFMLAQYLFDASSVLFGLFVVFVKTGHQLLIFGGFCHLGQRSDELFLSAV